MDTLEESLLDGLLSCNLLPTLVSVQKSHYH